MTPLNIAQRYFEASNRSNFVEIWLLLSDSSTYSSQNTGLYLGREAIIEMQQNFHESFTSLQWDIKEIYEEKPGIICVDFEFIWVKQWEEIQFSGLEYIIVLDGIIQHIEIKNK